MAVSISLEHDPIESRQVDRKRDRLKHGLNMMTARFPYADGMQSAKR
jgi:hypothetical protein